jgi:transposase
LGDANLTRHNPAGRHQSECFSRYADNGITAETNPLMRRGYSRDHRPDCLQLVLALIVNPEGFPCSYEVFNGNRADVTTLEVVMRMVERKYGKARRIWVMDRGIVSEANLAAIRKREGQY